MTILNIALLIMFVLNIGINITGEPTQINAICGWLSALTRVRNEII